MAGEFDTLALRRRVDEWRDEAARVPAGPMREFCLSEACRYERRLRASACTPVIYERSIETGWSTETLDSLDLLAARGGVFHTLSTNGSASAALRG
jgi:hypothetical protein